MIEVRYAGVVVGRSAIVRELDTRGLFLGITEPLPVGTPVVLHIGDKPGTDVPGRVEVVSEAQELANAGMRVRFTDPKAAALFGTPAEAPPEPEPPAAPALSPPVESPPAVSSVALSPDAAQPPTFARPEAAAAEAATGPSQSGHRRIVVDASTDRARAATATPQVAEAVDEGGDLSGASSSDTGRIPAPDPSAFGTPGGGKKGRRTRRR